MSSSIGFGEQYECFHEICQQYELKTLICALLRMLHVWKYYLTLKAKSLVFKILVDS